MRKRVDPAAALNPKPCGHPVITFEGNTEYACLWGLSDAFPIPVLTPEGDRMHDAYYEHFAWDPDLGMLLQVRPEMLAPDGSPFPPKSIWEVA